MILEPEPPTARSAEGEKGSKIGIPRSQMPEFESSAPDRRLELFVDALERHACVCVLLTSGAGVSGLVRHAFDATGPVRG